jgi:hypothetical protein
MFKKAIATFFLTLFMALITAPSIIVVLDDSTDISIFYSITEEEENSKTKHLELVVLTLEHNDYSLLKDFKSKFNTRYYNKTYLKPHLNLISPPPEFYIL